tara:strand:- start:16064 stop:19564 length:3501 start_codon:yes stop_codon:yes gene_type:complete
MNLKSLINYISKAQITKELIEKINKNNELNIIGSNRYAKALIINSIAKIENKNILLICATSELAYKWYGYFQNINDNNNVQYYPPNDYYPYEKRSKSSEVEFSQLNILTKLINKFNSNNNYIIITTEKALQPHLLKKDYFKKCNLNLFKGKKIEIKDLALKFSDLGYIKEEITTSEGNWSRRGDIIDIFPVNNEVPIRIEFYDNVIDKIREYDAGTQKTLDTVSEINIIQCGSKQKILKELSNLSIDKSFHHDDDGNLERFLGVVEENPSSIIDFISKETYLVTDELEQCMQFTDNLFIDSENNYENQKESLDLILSSNNINKKIEKNLFKPSKDIYQKLNSFQRINLFQFESKFNKTNKFLLSDKVIKSPDKSIKKISLEINEYIKNKEKVWILSAQPMRTNTILNDFNCFTKYIDNQKDIRKINNLLNLSTPIILKSKNNYEPEGFYLPIWKLAVFTDKELYSQQNLSSSVFIRKRKKSISSSIDVNKIKQGDFIVHKNHGIGQFIKIEKINVIGESRDYLVIQYSDGKVSVAADQLGSLNKYRCTGKIIPRINKLGGTEWEKVKEKNKKAIQKVAIDLLKLYAKRENLKGYSFPPDGPWQNELEDSFPHQPTPDQIKAVREIKDDMEEDKPMDRLICGDVGFGKTEVAIRAIFKAITSGKQVILLAPTTILAEQHWRTINNRFSPYPIKVSLLNRFKTKDEKNKIINGLKNNKIDLVVSTHQILGKDIEIKNLGLLVIDEEQRFGVKQKEKIKQIKQNIDVLTLTATPIPRTLYMSLSGIRKMSMLATPPPSRRSIKTYLSEIDLDTIRTAISREIDRGGQIFYVLPRISDIEQAIEKIKNMFQELKLIVAHGQMNERDLENAMITFNNGEADLMICTTIIESGLDIPRVNTIIIEDAHKFGLSQLYQLRGRVGRSGIQAHAWLFYPNINKINDSAKHRLKAIKDFTELGSGYQLAMKDMEIRGVGSILGESQSGQVNNIGYDLYMEMLHEAIADINGQEIPEVSDTQIDLPINAFIPGTWIINKDEKLEAYKNATACVNASDLTDLATDWVNRYGLIPKPVETLLLVMRMKISAKYCGFNKIQLKKPNILIFTKMKAIAFKRIKEALPTSIQSKFVYQGGKEISKIIIRGLGVTDIYNQIENLTKWFEIMSNSIESDVINKN